MNKLIKAIADLLSEERNYKLESVCDDYGLDKIDRQLKSSDSKEKYVLSRLISGNEEFLLDLASQLLESGKGGAKFARSINTYFPKGIFKLSAATRSSLLEEIVTLSENVDVWQAAEDTWEVNLSSSRDSLSQVGFKIDYIGDLFSNEIDFMYVSDVSIFKFLELLIHPRLCDEVTQAMLVDSFNRIISADGFQFRIEGYCSSEPFYKIYDIQSSITQSVKNLIFSAVGLKPELVLSDSLNNDVKIVKNESNCLVYESPIPKAGLTWNDLVAWWQNSKYYESEGDYQIDQRELYKRLVKSLDSTPEELFFKTYYKVTKGKYKKLPALIPQVYLHYDPYTFRQLKGETRLARQRMDFLLLLPFKSRVVIEIDGKHHYSEGNTSSPRLYSEMVSEDRELKLRGYDIFRFGGYELGTNSSNILIEEFIDKLFDMHAIEREAGVKQ